MYSANHSHPYSSRIALGLRLKDWRRRREMNIASAANALGVSTAAWGHWETGEHLPSGDLLIAIEDLTGMPLQVLFCPHLLNCRFTRDDPPPAGQSCCQCGASAAEGQV
jgi:transcriptional regulator with XRE-family HTH domain